MKAATWLNAKGVDLAHATQNLMEQMEKLKGLPWEIHSFAVSLSMEMPGNKITTGNVQPVMVTNLTVLLVASNNDVTLDGIREALGAIVKQLPNDKTHE